LFEELIERIFLNFTLLLIYLNLIMKRLIISVLMLMIATLIFSQGNKSKEENNDVNHDLVKVEKGHNSNSKL